MPAVAGRPGALNDEHIVQRPNVVGPTAIALTHRLCTFYLPPIWGYASLRWLRRGGYV